MTSFNSIYQNAIEQKGSEANLKALIKGRYSYQPHTISDINNITDDRYLSTISLRIFRAGLKHSLVDAKWPAFEKAFHNFNILGNAHLSDDAIAEHMQNTDLIRHLGKIKAIRINAGMILHASEEHGSFAQFIRQWPENDVIGLWAYLKKHGSQLGGVSGAYVLRMTGRDTFMFTNDVVTALIARKIIDKKPTAQRDLLAVQEKFNQWREESGWSYADLSLLLALTVG
ncbi:DNA-3-methyladenine glycosylase I [Litoribacillus peritrichatus]|uniref:DNA-3-methyladenine glycosylase I n=1 Tax=Litoribacillus peritrichatus TaxID=718191 RepID=A0ABP7MKM5_9GAMM